MDTALLTFINQNLASIWLDGIMIPITKIGEAWWIFAVLWGIWMIKSDQKGRLAGGIALLVLLLSDVGAASVIKPLVARPRPYFTLSTVRLITDGSRLSFFGFPSNHAANSAAIAVFISLLSSKKWVRSVLLLEVILVGFSRIYIGVHYPGDVAGGFIYGSLLGWAGVLLFRKISSHLWPPEKPGSSLPSA